MSLSKKLSKPLRAAESESEEEYDEEFSGGSSPSVLETGDGGFIASSDEDDEGAEEDEDESDGDDDAVQKQLSKVSFGALARAQKAISKQQSPSRKRKRETDGAGQEDKLAALRERLKELRDAKAAKSAKEEKPASKKAKTTAKSSKSKAQDKPDEEADSDAPSEEETKHARSSKHKPATMSSKRAVTRKRQVVEVKQRAVRDPRFDPVAGPPPDQHILNKRYSFLKDYKESEIGELRAAIKKTKNAEEKEDLKRQLLSMESRKKSDERKEKAQEVIREHRKKEKELVKQGKQPFYLKKSEQKKLVLVDKFASMKPKEREHLIERRRKKATAKERKNMPDERRV